MVYDQIDVCNVNTFNDKWLNMFIHLYKYNVNILSKYLINCLNAKKSQPNLAWQTGTLWKFY